MKLVGYKGEAFGGGAHPSECADPAAAAAEHFTEANLGGFPEGMDAIKECRISDWDAQRAWRLERVAGGDPTTPAGWRLVDDIDMVEEGRKERVARDAKIAERAAKRAAKKAIKDAGKRGRS